ncbi:MAG: ABC transporter substrate-binding protein [Ruminococcaceae bacterium]|nr:ABC transporter substrate-binding protein [Oscillospiraceae bacterium]
MKKAISFFMIAVIFVISLSVLGGCNKESAETIYFLNFKPESAAAYDEIAKVYKEEKGVELKVVTAASGTYEQTLKSEMAKSTAPTIFQINGPKGYANWKSYCKDLKDTALYNALTDKNLAITEGDGVYGIPYVVEGYGIIYNSEIVDKYFALDNKKVKLNSVEEIKSFADLKAVVEDMTANKEKLGIDGVFASTSLKTGEDWRWQTHLANIPIHYEFKKNGTNISTDDLSEIKFEYAENFKNIFDLYINNSVTDKKLLGSKSVTDSMAEFALGKCAMVQNGNWAWSQIRDVAGNKVKEENIKFLPIYTGIEGEETQGLCIGTESFICINKNASEEQQKLSEEFLYWLYSSDTGKKLVTEKLDFIAPFSTFEEAEAPKDPLAKEIIRYMNRDNVTTIPWDFTVFPSQTFKENFGAGLLSYSQGSKTFEEIKNDMINDWKKESK